MSGHSKWAKIKHKKGAEDAKRGAVFTKISKEITAAAKDGGGNTESNIRLRAAVARAREYNMPSSNVENAIKKGTGELPGIVFETVVFDAYGPGGVAMLIEGLTDNKNRTTSEIRNLLSKKGGSMAGAGSTAWLFSKKGLISVEKSKAGEDAVMEAALEAGADDIKAEDDTFDVYCDPGVFEAVKNAMTAKKIELASAEVTMIPSSTVKVQGNDARNILELMEALEEHEDIQNVHANFDISNEEMAKISAG
ncbi:MAG: YebC/PmpR family DNA-binding transcriptional regulator [Candidatus Omnitrophica bacterium]|nr:YebC/PmpR family DNA-binding transcriptional regulator [Candidatus Omnitrophota bacterium]MDE2008656.1 YebC/PmpR family DNA-binding transcriptional regulator [Candidatus Omnitrophota bacterium]MDE2214961.1 YebC/PmpR family DNA-binding transcriptional regulator [Candidatus Omnitrophota bacterium]MDE2230900.1 YebC/PmpR family DNA-binding transcriptional regulator [Candidatus Omnitrophota bacterium]